MDKDEVLRRARSGPAALFARRVFAIIISLLTVLTVPHLVGPRAYGLAAMSTILFGLAELFKDFGLTSAIMRKGEVNEEEVNFLFWFNLSTTMILAAVIVVIAPLVASYFREPIVLSVILVSLVGFVTGGAALQHRAIISRELRFTTIAMVDSMALLAQFLVTICLALMLHNVWAIVLGSVTSSVISSVIIVCQSGWRPGRPRLVAEARAILVFGANTSVYSFSVFLSNSLLAILVGHLLGSASLGQLNRASALYSLPQRNFVDPIAQAALPVLARLRPFPAAYRQTYLELVRNLNLLVVPASLITFSAAPSLTVALLGERWRLAGVLLQALSPSLAALGFGYAAGDLFVTQNRAAEMRSLGLVELAIRAAAVTIALHWGIVAATYGFSIATLAVVSLRIAVVGRKGAITIGDHLVAAAPALPLGFGAMVGAYLGVRLKEHAHLQPVAGAAIIIVLAAIGAVGAAVATPSSRATLRKATALAWAFVKSRRQPRRIAHL